MGQKIGLSKNYPLVEHIIEKQGTVRIKDAYRGFKTSVIELFVGVRYYGCPALKYASCF